MSKTPKPISELIPRIVLEAVAKHRAIEALQRRWKQLVGAELARHTQPASLRKGKLYVCADEPGACFLLNLEKPRLLEKLRAQGRTEIEEIIIRPGELVDAE